MNEREYIFWLMDIPGMGCQKIKNMLEQFGTPKDVYHAKRCQLEQVQGIRAKDLDAIQTSHKPDRIKYRYEMLEKKGIRLICQIDMEYPDKLRTIYQAPFGLFVRGNLPDASRKNIAIVGARSVSHSGKQIARKIGRQMAENGIGVISGLARGADIAAQKGVLEIAGGQTYGVLGCGIDVCYPSEHIKSYEQIPMYGGMISEYSMGVAPLAGFFPMRNRIISGLADGILVVEAREKSGSLITAQLGLEQGKDIFVIPGDIMNPAYTGSNALIQNGASLVTNARDILDSLGIFLDENVSELKKKNNVMLETTEKIVYSYLSLEPVHLSELTKLTGLELAEVMDACISLEIRGLVQNTGNHHYAMIL